MGYSTEKLEKYAQEKNINPLTTVTPFFENTWDDTDSAN